MITKLEIDRLHWRHGGNVTYKATGNTELLNDHGLMCCLGFHCIAEGMSTAKIKNLQSPDQLITLIDVLTVYDRTGDCITTDFTDNAMDINDDRHLTNEEREKKLIAHFLTENIELVFTGNYEIIELVTKPYKQGVIEYYQVYYLDFVVDENTGIRSNTIKDKFYTANQTKRNLKLQADAEKDFNKRTL